MRDSYLFCISIMLFVYPPSDLYNRDVHKLQFHPLSLVYICNCAKLLRRDMRAAHRLERRQFISQQGGRHVVNFEKRAVTHLNKCAHAHN